MSVYFVDLKYGHTLNIGFSLEDGRGINDFDLDRYAVGDRVELMAEVSEQQADLIICNCTDKMVDLRKGGFHSVIHMFIAFTVTEKRHVLVPSRKSSIALSPLSSSIYLRPVSWGHEDIFKWLFLGVRPSWIDDEEWQGVRP